MFFVEAQSTMADKSLQSLSDFWLFVVYCLVVIVVVIFFLFYFNRVLGQILTFIINQYSWRRYNAYIEVESIRVSLLGGRILFKNLRYLSTNQSISIVKGHIAFRYWLFNVRKSDDDKTDKARDVPCRVSCKVEGLEWFFYNNAPAYERMKDVLGLSTSDSHQTSTTVEMEHKELNRAHGIVDPESQTPMNVDNSLMERLMPFQFEFTTAAVMIGNTELKSMLVWKVSQASGIYSITKPRSSMDFYKSVIDVILRKVQISLKDNMDYTNVDETIQIINPIPKTSFVSILLKPFRFLHPFARTRQYGKMQHMRDIMKEGRTHDGNTSENTTFHEEYARVNNIVECNEMALTYYSDYAGPVPTPEATDGFYAIGVDIGNGGLPPEWGIRISLWDATIHYGPWADRQRSEMQDYFFPNSHRANTPTPKLKPGQQRVATCFETYIEFMNEGNLRVPTREKSKDWKYTSASPDLDIGPDGYYTRPYGWLDIKAGEGSFVKVITPFVLKADGSVSEIDIVLKETDITTSVNYASFIQSNRIEIQIKMPAPLQWNGYRHWDFKITPKKPTIFLLRDHIYLLQDTVKDWASTPPADLLHFTPITYQLKFNLENPKVYLCVNEHNVINNPNSIEDNAFLKIESHRLTFDVTLPFTEFQSETTSIKFFVTIEHGCAGLSLQTSHTLNAFMREDDAHAAVAVNVSVDGTYDYYSSVDILRHIESCNLHIKINGATIKLFGSLIRYIFLLKDNYFGAWNNFSTIDEYRRRRNNYSEWLDLKKRQADSKPMVDPFEVYVLMELEDGVLLFPENLYECSRYSQFEFQELQLEMRNLDVYLDLYVNISPIIMSRDSNPNPQSKQGFFRIKNARDPKNYVYIDGLNVYAHRLFGPLPECATYVCQWEFDIGKITGEIKPSFLLGLACFGQSFAYNLIDEDNAVPQEMESNDLPDVTFVKLFVQEVDLCLMSMNSATNINLNQGILLEFDNLINAKYSQRITLKIPSILMRCLANPDQARGSSSFEDNEYSWVEVAKVDLGLNVTVFRHTAMWKKRRSEQQNFIRNQDYPTRRCVRLYEEVDTTSQSSHQSMRTASQHHVGVLYVPPFRPFISGHVEDKSVLYDTRSYSSDTASADDQYRSYSSAGSSSSIHPSSVLDMLYIESEEDDNEEQSDYDIYDASYDRYSTRSAVSKDNESYHTAIDSESDNDGEELLNNYSIADDYSFLSGEDDFSSTTDQSVHARDIWQKDPERNLTAAIPPSIPYSDYLRRFKVSRQNSEYAFFHPYIPPSRPYFIPEKDYEEKGRPLYENAEDDPNDYFKEETDRKERSDSQSEDADAFGKGHEVIATTVIEATSSVIILVTPILVKIIQELAEEIIKDDWDLETMLDALQMEYIEQLTRYLTDQHFCTRFAVILPQTYLHFIQNVTVPDDLPSYKHGESFVKTQYNPEDTVLCSADIFLNDFRMIGSVKFEDCAFDEKKKKVAESNIVLQESRLHMDIGDMGSTVQYVSLLHERQPIAFGIPYESLRNKRLYSNLDNDTDTLIDELVMLDLAVKGFSFKCLGAREPNYAEMNVQSLDTIIVTESVEILVGAVYSWLVFVDDLKGILASFQDRRSRQVQVFISEIAKFSIRPDVAGDPIFLTTPTSMSRLGSHNFRNDVGWKLLARMRHCLRSMRSSTREELQYRLTSGGALQDINSEDMFTKVVDAFSLWRNWEVNYDDIASCRLFTQPYKQKPTTGDAVPKNMTDEVVRFLISSANFAKLRLVNFKFTIYEEETADMRKEENSISISYVEFLLECLYKSSLISSVAGAESNNQRSTTPTALDGYLDIIAKVSFGNMDISTNPIILAFARHMLLVQRVFTTKLKNLSHDSRSLNNTVNSITSSSSAPSEPLSTMNKENDFSFDALLSKVDIVAHALVSVDRVQVTAHAQELRMDTLVSGIHGSALFSNPKLAPLQLTPYADRDSDTGSGKRSSNRASRRSTYSEPRLVLEAAGGINIIDIKFKEEHRLNDVSTLLAIVLEKANVNANLSQIAKSSKKYSRIENSKDVLNVFSNIHRFHFNVPQSLLRLYGFIESWQTEQGRRYHFMFQNLIKEWEEQRKDVASPSSSSSADPNAIAEQTPTSPNPNGSSSTITSKKLDIKLQFLLNEFVIEADLLPSLSVEYRIVDLFFMINQTHQKLKPVHMYAFQLSKQVVHLITKDAKSANYVKSDGMNMFSIPGICSTGSLRTEMINGVNQLKLRSMISVDLIAMSLDASMIDSLLTAQSLVGSEVSELVEVLSYSMRKNPTTTTSNSTDSIVESQENQASNEMGGRIFKYTVDVSLDGLRVSASSPSAVGMFRSNLLEASISNDTVTGVHVFDQLTWKLHARNFSLSLDHNTVEGIDDTLTREEAVYHRNVLAYILADFKVQNYLQVCPNEDCMHNTHAHDKESDTIFINFSRIQTVMQPIALGKLAEMYIYYNAELRKKKMMKKAEIDQLSANTKRIVQSITIKNEWPKTLPEDTQSLLEGKIISLHVRRLGVAIPLGEQPDLTGIEVSNKGVSALLLSVTSIEFLSKNIEKGALQLDNFALQFVTRFDQNKADHFIAENHPRMNQISFPSISCHVSASNAKLVQSVTVDARVRGFEVDVDGTIADYINTLSIIYVKSMDRVDAFTAKAKYNSDNASSSSKPSMPPGLDSSEVVHLDIECKFECDSGAIRMYPKRHSNEAQKNKGKHKVSLRSRPGLDARPTGEGNMATVDLPGLNAWVTYQTRLGAHASVVNTPKRFHADVLILESRNTLHPALVQFLHEVITGLKLGMQQSSERKADRDATTEIDSNLNASLFLRLSKTHLDLSCQPSSKVVCGLGWEESEFLMNTFSKDTTSRTMSCVGSVREITAVVKHHFSPEPCLNARIDRILFNAMLSSQREGGDSNDDISIIIDVPNVLGDLNMRHLQDLLTLNACWFDQTMAQETNPSSAENNTTSLLNKPLEVTGSGPFSSSSDANMSDTNVLSHPPAPFSKHIAVRMRNIKFFVDLGQNIGKVVFSPDNLSFQLHHVPYESKGLCLSLEQIKVSSEGRLSGFADFKQIVLQGHLKQSNDGSKETASICVRSDGFKATFEYEYQNILDAIQQSLELNIDLHKVHKEYDLQVSINLEALIARLSVKTVPVIITMVQKFNELLQKKKEEAGIRPSVIQMDTTLPKSDSSSVPSNNKYRYEQSFIRSRVSISTQAVEIVIYPSQFQDSDNVDVRAKQFKVVLEEFPRNQQGIYRKLVITLSSAALAKNVPGKELMVRYSSPLLPLESKPTVIKNLGGTNIFGIPGTEITMESTQLDRNIEHEFGANFAGRVSVSLNIGLIKYLQEMINMFNLQLDRALDNNSDKMVQTPTSEPSTPVSQLEDTEESQSVSRRPSLLPRKSRQTQTPSTPTLSATSDSVPASNTVNNTHTKEPEIPIEKYVYTSINSVNFQPQLQVMGDATPPVEWLGLRRERIPGLVHENITLHLDQLVKVIWIILESQAD